MKNQKGCGCGCGGGDKKTSIKTDDLITSKATGFYENTLKGDFGSIIAIIGIIVTVISIVKR